MVCFFSILRNAVKVERRANALAVMHQLEAFVDVFERQLKRHILVDLELALRVQINDLGQLGRSSNKFYEKQC